MEVIWNEAVFNKLSYPEVLSIMFQWYVMWQVINTCVDLQE